MRNAAIATIAISLASCGAVVTDDPSATDAAVSIRTTGCQPMQSGAGVAVDTKLVLTAAHVVAGARTVEVTTSAGLVLDAVPVVIDTDLDIAVLRVAELGVAPASLAADRVYATAGVALPQRQFGLVHAPLVHVARATTTDIHRSREVVKVVLQLDYEAALGDSGAAVLDGSNAVAGIVVSVAEDIDNSFAVHVIEFRHLLDDVPTVRAARGSCSR